jgi:hypothetical protein
LRSKLFHCRYGRCSGGSRRGGVFHGDILQLGLFFDLDRVGHGDDLLFLGGVSLVDPKLEMYDDDDMDWEHRNVSVLELLRERELRSMRDKFSRIVGCPRCISGDLLPASITYQFDLLRDYSRCTSPPTSSAKV